MANKTGDARRVVRYALDSPPPPVSVSGPTLKGTMLPSHRQRNKACETADADRVKTSTVIDRGFGLLVCFFSIGAPKPGPTHARQVPCPGLHLPFHQSVSLAILT